MELAGSTVLVTGASAGIGAAVAEQLAGAGAAVIVHGRDPERTAEVARRVRGTPLVADLHDPDAARTVARQALAPTGHVDVLVAGAGRGWAGPFTAMDDADVEGLVGLNLLATLRLVRLLLPPMVERGAGHVVVVTSVAGRTGVAGESVYAATKAGLDAFAESLRLELDGTGVGVSVIVPAAVRTDFFTRRGRPYDRSVPRPLPPARVATAVVAAIRHDRAEVWLPRWVRLASAVRVLAPGLYRRLSARLGEQVRSDRDDSEQQGDAP